MEANNNKNKNVLHEHGAHLRSLRSYSTVQVIINYIKKNNLTFITFFLIFNIYICFFQSPLELAAFSSSYIPFFTYKTSDFIYNLRQCLTKRLQDGVIFSYLLINLKKNFSLKHNYLINGI